MSKRASVGVPIGVAAAVVAAVFLGVVLRSEGGRPAALPLSLAGSGGTSQEGGATSADAKTMAGAPTGGVTYRYVGEWPSDLPDDADVFALKGGAPSRAAVLRLAEALGISGNVTTEQDALVVRDGEWVLRVSTSTSRMWSYYREVKSPPCDPAARGQEGISPEEYKKLPGEFKKLCAGVIEPDPGSGGGSAGICLEGADSPCNDTPETTTATAKADPPPPSDPNTPVSDQPLMSCPVPASCPPDTKCEPNYSSCRPYQEPAPLPLPSESVARATAQKVFDAAGVGSGSTIRADRGYDAWFISATVRVGGLEVIGLGHSVSIDGDGEVRDASGSLAAAEVLDRYPLVTPQVGLDRLEKQFGQYGKPRSLILCAPETPDCNGPAEPTVREVTGVRLALLFSPVWENETEQVFLVPAWAYDIVGSDYPEAVIAITDEFLKGVAPGQPGDEPRPDPAQTEPGQTQVDPAPPQSDPPAPRPDPASAQPTPSEHEPVSAAPAPGSTEPSPGSGQTGPDETASAEPEPAPS